MAKAQFYLFAGIILASLVFLVVSSSSFVEKRGLGKTKSLLDNYEYEANIIINNAIYSEKNISTELRNFTEYFISTSENKDINLKILFMYSRDDMIYIVNYLNGPVSIPPYTLEAGEEISIDYSDAVSIEYENETYEFSFSSQNTELKTLFVGE